MISAPLAYWILPVIGALAGLTFGCGTAPISTAAVKDRVGNGGTVVVDGVEYHLGDLYFKSYVGDSFTYDDEMAARLTVLRKNLEHWGLPVGRFFEEQVFSDLITIYVVATLPDECHDVMDVPGHTGIQFACTRGYVTWIVPQYFMPLSPEEKAAALIHERLHAFAPSQPHEVIVPFVLGALVMQLAYPDPTSHPHFTADDINKMHMFRFASRQLGMMAVDPFGTYAIHPFGGGFIKGGSAAATAFLGLGAVVTDSEIKEAVVIDDANVSSSSIGVGVRIGVDGVGENPIVEQSTILDNVIIERGSIIVGSTVGHL